MITITDKTKCCGCHSGMTDGTAVEKLKREKNRIDRKIKELEANK